jgi:SsrA-binding protein
MQPMSQRKAETHRTVCVNRKARFDYELLEHYELGMVLAGSEVKALREGKGNLTDSYVALRDGRPVVHNLEISPYSHDQSATLATRRDRDLLLNRLEIRKLQARLKKEKGLTLVPLSVYFKGPWAKLEVAVAKGRKRGDKREVLKRREAQRDIDRAGRERR